MKSTGVGIEQGKPLRAGPQGGVRRGGKQRHDFLGDVGTWMMQAWTGVKLLFWWHWKVGFPKTHVASLLWLLCSFPTCLPRSGENGWDGGKLSIAPVLAGIQRGIYLVPSLLWRLCQCPIDTQHLQGLELGSLPVLTRWVLWVGWFGPLAGEEGEEEGHSWEIC